MVVLTGGDIDQDDTVGAGWINNSYSSCRSSAQEARLDEALEQKHLRIRCLTIFSLEAIGIGQTHSAPSELLILDPAICGLRFSTCVHPC